MTKINKNYEKRYKSQKFVGFYPTEFLVRSFLGTYPHLSGPPRYAEDQHVLDLGFGDGRNIPFLNDLGLNISGVEITQTICDTVERNLKNRVSNLQLRVGRNNSIPFENASFDHVVSCHSCYYVDKGSNFSENLREIARVCRPRARIVCSLPMLDSYLFKEGKIRDENHIEVTCDPYNLRNGYILRGFETTQEIEDTFSEFFDSFEIGACRNDWWGVHEYCWLVVCHRRSTEIQ